MERIGQLCGMPPKVSIVTVVFNDVSNIESTLESVKGQSYDSIEYVVIDGDSQDGTKDVLSRHNDLIDIMVSEPDDGIYDAMNKGARCSSGEWVLFMNSGDQFFSNQVLCEVFRYERTADVLFGDHHVRFLDGRMDVMGKAGRPEDLILGSQFSHQSSLARRELLLERPFRTDNMLSADHYFFLGCYETGKIFEYCPQPIASVSAGGVSDTQQVRVIKEWEASAKELAINRLNLGVRLKYLLMILRAIVASAAKRILIR